MPAPVIKAGDVIVGAIDGVDWGILFAAATLQLPPESPRCCTVSQSGN